MKCSEELLRSMLRGQEGKNRGRTFGSVFKGLYDATGGLGCGDLITVFGASKSGKSSFVNNSLVYEPLSEGRMKVIYYSLEMSRENLLYDALCYYLQKDHGVNAMCLDSGRLFMGLGYIRVSQNLLKGRLCDQYGERIGISMPLRALIAQVIEERIIPIFDSGNIQVIDKSDNPTGIIKRLCRYLEGRGEFEYGSDGKRGELYWLKALGYKSQKDEGKLLLVVIDTVRSLHIERGYNMKMNIDKMLEYCNDLRRVCGNVSFVFIVHTNTSFESIKRREQVALPDYAMTKDSANFSEVSTLMLSVMNVQDGIGGQSSHMGLELVNPMGGGKMYNDVRCVSVSVNRYGESGMWQHCGLDGASKTFYNLGDKFSICMV